MTQPLLDTIESQSEVREQLPHLPASFRSAKVCAHNAKPLSENKESKAKKSLVYVKESQQSSEALWGISEEDDHYLLCDGGVTGRTVRLVLSKHELFSLAHQGKQEYVMHQVDRAVSYWVKREDILRFLQLVP